MSKKNVEKYLKMAKDINFKFKKAKGSENDLKKELMEYLADEDLLTEDEFNKLPKNVKNWYNSNADEGINAPEIDPKELKAFEKKAKAEKAKAEKKEKAEKAKAEKKTKSVKAKAEKKTKSVKAKAEKPEKTDENITEKRDKFPVGSKVKYSGKRSKAKGTCTILSHMKSCKRKVGVVLQYTENKKKKTCTASVNMLELVK